MNKRAGANINSKKAPLHPQNGKQMELKVGKSQPPERSLASRRRLARERKLALLQDVDNLKKKLRYEENVHRALERAFNRPLGALPRFPPYLPQYTVELLAEVAVLEEEVVRLEEQVVNFRQGLYHEAVYISSANSADNLPSSSNELPVSNSRQKHSRSLSHSEVTLGSFGTMPSPSLSRTASIKKLLTSHIVSDGKKHCSDQRPRNGKQKDLLLENGLGKENQSSPLEKKSLITGSPAKIRQLKPELNFKHVNAPKFQYRTIEQANECSSSSSDDRIVDFESEANRTSEEILKCLISIFVRLSCSKGKTMDSESFASLSAKTSRENVDESDFRDPYCNSCEVKKRDIGTYKHLYSIEPGSVDLNRKTNASFLMRRLKLLLGKLASVNLEGLSHQHKVAFWINIYNSCIMNAFLEHGIPDSPEKIVMHMQRATIEVGGYVLNALMIEHLILRLPYHLKYTCSKSIKSDETKVCRAFGLEWSEPLVTFALCCGSWSSPAVRIYTASQIETELETAKREYLQAAVGISTANKLIIPKLLDWYLLDFAKDLDALLDWVCLQLGDDLRKEAVECLERKRKEPLSELIQVMPYNFSFRYLICR